MKIQSLSTITLLSMLLAACAPGTNGTASNADTATVPPPASATATTPPPVPCNPVESATANAPEQKATFAGQTRICAEPTNVAVDVTVVATGLDHPWAVEPLPDGNFLVTERAGRLRLISATGVKGQPISGLPRIETGGQGGLLDVALTPTFATDRTIYWSFTEARDGGNGTSVARGVLSTDRSRVEQARVIFRALPAYENHMHYGSRLAFGPDGMLYVTLGERADTPMRKHSQDPSTHLGTIVRITPDGTAPQDNPWIGKSNARPEVWTIGHRNVQASAFDAQGNFWIVEHGPKGGDELNLIRKGRNYGWPLVTFGEEYSGQPIANAVTTRTGFEDPVYYWDPVIAPSGAQFYTGTAFPAWRNSLFIGGLVPKSLVRLTIQNDKVTGEEHLLKERGKRLRDVRQGSDGALYIVTDEDNGELWRVAPRR
jgi:aldose sugar dehydrogenase